MIAGVLTIKCCLSSPHHSSLGVVLSVPLLGARKHVKGVVIAPGDDLSSHRIGMPYGRGVSQGSAAGVASTKCREAPSFPFGT